MAVKSGDERRRFSRIAFHRPAQLGVGTAQVICEVVDVSLKGALVQVPRAFQAKDGEHCTLTIRLDAGDAVIRMNGEIAHRQGTSVGVRCTDIDLDSIAHLRRLVELNLGDDAMLSRELSALVGSRGRGT